MEGPSGHMDGPSALLTLRCLCGGLRGYLRGKTRFVWHFAWQNPGCVALCVAKPGLRADMCSTLHGLTLEGKAYGSKKDGIVYNSPCKPPCKPALSVSRVICYQRD